MNIKTYIITYAYTTKTGEVHCLYDSSHIGPSEAHKRKDEIEESLQQKQDVSRYDIDVVAAVINHNDYKMGV